MRHSLATCPRSSLSLQQERHRIDAVLAYTDLLPDLSAFVRESARSSLDLPAQSVRSPRSHSNGEQCEGAPFGSLR